MIYASTIVIVIVALLHLYFLVLEMFLWDKPYGLKTFNQKLENAKISKVLAANQGLYNGFLSAGLIWGLLLTDNGFSVKLFFLICVVVAGIFGGITVNRRILFIQATPAIIGIILVVLAK